MSNERYSRQSGLIPMERLLDCSISVIGVGAIGRQVALQLAAMGAKSIQLVDFDTVEISNVASQGYWENDVGRLKVDATADACRKINSECDVVPISKRFRRSGSYGDVVFCCVDKIQVRELIWETLQNKCKMFIDGRMSAESLRVISACDKDSRAHYVNTLFAANEAYRGSCTAKSTIYCANIAAGMMISRFTKWLRGMSMEKDTSFNILSEELMVEGA